MAHILIVLCLVVVFHSPDGKVRLILLNVIQTFLP